MIGILAASSLLAAIAPITIDAEKHAVTLSVVSTDCGVDTPLEFLIAGPNSDRAYESMFVTEASVKEIVESFRKAGIPLGRPYHPSICHLWPAGCELVVDPPLSTFVKDAQGQKDLPVIYTGGTFGPDGIPEAETNMPSAVFALYSCSQSPILYNDALDQSVTYGRFQPAVKIPKGEKRAITFTWKGKPGFEFVKLPFAPGHLEEAIQTLKEKSANGEVVVETDFSPTLTLREASEIASALATVDSVRVKMNGAADGQYFFRAYVPLEKWRDRKERLCQPPEVHLLADGKYRVIKINEDWSEPGSLEPKLSTEETVCDDAAAAAKLASRFVGNTLTMLLFAPKDAKLSRLYEFRKSVSANVINYYIFSE